ncbi:MAG: MoxR family ATPase [Elusimicrobiota bacterium]
METTAETAGLAKLIAGINSVLIGKEEAVLETVVTLIARGHLLIEDVPGIGKTLLALALAKSIDASFRRIQFTNDLLPSDILGLNLYNQREQRFEFRPGPIFSHVVLADEINRSTPKTQSALLEAMNERQVSIEGKTYRLEEPYLVIATENPVEYHGTFPLPEAQLDRFLMRVQIGYPAPADEKSILRGGDINERLGPLEPALSMAEVTRLQERVATVHMDDELMDYIVAIARATREDRRIKLGLSPRGSQALCRAAMAFALVAGRDYCVPDDIKRLAVPVAAHRLLLDSGEYGMARVKEAERLVADVLQRVPAPR